MAEIRQYLTFDDVLFLPQYSEILPRDVDVRTNLTKKLKLSIPLISAAMDTVTEHELAIQMALQGGVGIIHKNLTPDEEAEEVKKVKRFENGFIREPVAVKPEDKVAKVIEIREKHGYNAVPVTENGRPNGKLMGIITKNDYFTKHTKQKVKERMTPFSKLLWAKKGISLDEAYAILGESKYGKLLVINNKKERKLWALVTRKDIEKKELYPLSIKDEHGRLLVGAAVGPAKNMEERVEKLVKAEVDVLVVDTAHGHSKGVIDTVKYVKKNYKVEVIAGNVGTEEAAEALIKAGADAVKVGVGPGSICTTRVVTGMGVPQFSAIQNCVKAARGRVPVIADGGIRYSGDVAKAIAAGASVVMIGSLFAGTEESPGEVVYREGKTFKTYRGMGSIAAMRKGGKERYGQASVTETEKFVPEGIEGLILYKGSVVQEIYQLIGGLRSSMGYQGAKDVKDLQKKAKFVQVSPASLRESHPHDVVIAREAPNYRFREL
ncbi:MAG TPA: IMP dehydrogenase [Candidatus Atribacteria bacterium]|nr:IMP dehydrogenase [Candidatus Atribacteria bacterium]